MTLFILSVILMTTIKKLFLSLLLLLAGTYATKTPGVGEAVIGATSFPDASWVMISNFSGYQTSADPSKIADGANPQGQNTTVNDGDRISVRGFGTEIFPSVDTASSSESPITGTHVFHKRNGESVFMRTFSNRLEFFATTSSSWELLATTSSSNKKYGFADYNINTDISSYVYFGNASDPFARWTGTFSAIKTSVTAGQTYIDVDSVNLFPLGTSSIIYCGAVTTASSASTTINRIYLTGTAPVSCSAGKPVARQVETFSDLPRGNIYLVENNRLFISGVASTSQAVFFSYYGQPTNFTSPSLVSSVTALNAGYFNLGEGGGGVTSMVSDEGTIYMFKRSTIRKATLNDLTYTLTNLKPFDGKSQTIGSIGVNSVFTGDNAVFFITPDKQIMSLQRVESFDYPQIVPISKPIQPTVDGIDNSSAVGIFFRNKAYFAIKANSEDAYNNTILVYNLDTKAWDSPIVGLNVSGFSVYDDGESEELYVADAVSPNIYKITDEANDNGFPVVASWRSKQFDFGKPQSMKQMVDLYLDGYIKSNTTLNISLLLDENGYTQKYSTSISGDNTQYLYGSEEYNAFGLSPFGVYRFGSQDASNGMQKFRVYLGSSFTPRTFYTAQLELASDGESQEWEVGDFGFRVKEYSQPEKRELYKAFK